MTRFPDFRDQQQANADQLAFAVRPRARKVMAKVTSRDAATGRYSWTERTYNANGARIDKADGLTGTTTNNPAYGYGDGAVITSFPADVTLTERTWATDGTSGDPLGMVWEFPVYCACAGGGSGGGGYVLCGCCPNPIPATLYCTVNVRGESPLFPDPPGATGGPILSTYVVPLINTTGDTWSGYFTPSGCTRNFEVNVNLTCATRGGGALTWNFTAFVGSSALISFVNGGPLAAECNPFHLLDSVYYLDSTQLGGNFVFATCPGFPGVDPACCSVWQFDITE
jgi:hypothetical protein